MKLISESCCGRQRVVLKLELWSTAGFAFSLHTCQCKQSGNIFASLLHICQMQHFTANELL